MPKRELKLEIIMILEHLLKVQLLILCLRNYQIGLKHIVANLKGLN